MRSTSSLRSARLVVFALGIGCAPALARAQDKPEGVPKVEPAAADSKKEETKAEAPKAPAPAPVAAPAGSAVVPEPRPGAWIRQHEAFLERGRRGEVDLLFLGDSITAGWNGAGAIWSRYYAPRKAANFGIGGDRTQHVLWRLDNGEVDAIRPKVVVLMIGTNNIGRNAEDEVAEGVKAVVDRVRSKLPDAKVLLLGVFPRGSNRDKTVPTVGPDPRVARINARLAAFDDGRAVRYLDIGVAFLDDAGQVSRAIMPDFLHLNRKGYQLWADAIEPRLWEMMAETP